MADSNQFQASAQRWKQFEDYCGNVNASILLISKRILSSQHASDEEKRTRLAALQDCTKQIAKIDAEAKYRHQLTMQVAQALGSVQRGEDVSELVETYKGGCEEAVRRGNSTRFDNVQEVKQIEQMMRTIQNADGSDDEIQENLSSAPQAQRCPVLGGVMTNPVLNTECGHVYSLMGAISFLFQKNAPRGRAIPESLDRVPEQFSAICPRTGCRKQFSAGTLKRDYATELTQRQAQQSASMRRDSLDVEELV